MQSAFFRLFLAAFSLFPFSVGTTQATYVNWSPATAAVVPAAVVTETSTTPGVVDAGATAEMLPSDSTVKLTAGVVPNLTAVTPVKS
jgi:hypothetical protein